MSESEQYQTMLAEEERRRYQSRVDARTYILKNWERFGYTEFERDEIIGAMGLTEDELSKNLGWSEGQSLSRGGLGASMGKFSTPRKPPTRAQ